MVLTRPGVRKPDELKLKSGSTENSIHDSSATQQQWTLEGDARILKVLRARGFPADQMVPMLVELQAGKLLSQRDGNKAWNPVSGQHSDRVSGFGLLSQAY
jgi:hypothetical protein